jgi:hypothetical protein
VIERPGEALDAGNRVVTYFMQGRANPRFDEAVPVEGKEERSGTTWVTFGTRFFRR